MNYPKSFNDLIESFNLLPGIGPKTSERLAYHVLTKLSSEDVKRFSESLINAKQSLKKCKYCNSLCEDEICNICLDDTRDKTILIVENYKEVISFERTRQYRGYYFVLDKLISPSNGITPNDINLLGLYDIIKKYNIHKVIIATSCSIAGEMTSMYIKNCLNDYNCEVYRIGYGLPVGGDIEYADDFTLLKSLESIKKL